MINWAQVYRQHQQEKNFWITQLFKIQRVAGIKELGSNYEIRRKYNKIPTDKIKSIMTELLKSLTHGNTI